MIPGNSTYEPSPLTHDESATLLGHTIGFVAVTAALFALGAYVGRNASPSWSWVWFIVALVCRFGMGAAVQRSERLAIGLPFGVGVLLGLAVAPTVASYAKTEPQAVWQAGGASALFILGFGAAGG